MSILRVGTDCSGIEAPIQALIQLEIPFKHVFSSDIDKFCIQSIKANYDPDIIFGDPDGPYPNGDITQRDIRDVPDIDFYVAGFPCQPFSFAGKREGFEHKSGNVFWSCLEVIETKRPKYFILENVKGLLSNNKGETWNVIWSSICGLEKVGYTVAWKVLNTCDYGIPQNRERVFILGIREKEFNIEWPMKTKMGSLEDYVDWGNTETRTPSKTCQKILQKLKTSPIFINIGLTDCINKNTQVCPTIIRANHQMWCIPLMRFALPCELLGLQGFTYFKQVVSISQIFKQIGNSMSVNVLKCILKETFKL